MRKYTDRTISSIQSESRTMNGLKKVERNDQNGSKRNYSKRLGARGWLHERFLGIRNVASTNEMAKKSPRDWECEWVVRTQKGQMVLCKDRVGAPRTGNDI